MTPLSAIDWLSQSVEQPPTFAPPPPILGTQATRTPPPDEAPVASSATTPQVSVQPLDGPAPRTLGILSPDQTGFPIDLWQGSDGETLTALLLAQDNDTLPAHQELVRRLILTQAAPPREIATSGQFFQARVDVLLAMGALEQAQALLESANPNTPELFRRWFDVSLLTGTEAFACRAMRSTPDVAPTPAARAFCLARTGDWGAAALTLNTGRMLGDIDPATGDLLARFLDPELFEGTPTPAPPSPVTPLTFRMFEAIGEPLNTSSLPLAFAHANLRDNVGWKAQLEAAERLAQRGAIGDNLLLGLYTQARPSASGGVFERARAVQTLEAALASNEPSDLEAALAMMWQEAHPRGILPAFARHFAPALQEANVPQASQPLLFKMLLLTDAYETAALRDDLAATDPFLASLALGAPDGSPSNWLHSDTVRGAFSAAPDPDLVEMAATGRRGEAILRILAVLGQGLEGDQHAFQESIATLRAIGLEDIARRMALQYILLDIT